MSTKGRRGVFNSPLPFPFPSAIPASLCHSRENENPSLLSILDPRFREGDGEGVDPRFREGDGEGVSFPPTPSVILVKTRIHLLFSKRGQTPLRIFREGDGEGRASFPPPLCHSRLRAGIQNL